MEDDSQYENQDKVFISSDENQLTKKFGLIALFIGFLYLITLTILFLLLSLQPFSLITHYIIFFLLPTFIGFLLLPIVVTYKIEKRETDSLGLIFKRTQRILYVKYLVFGIISIFIIWGIEVCFRVYLGNEPITYFTSYHKGAFSLVEELLFQMIQIALPEELFFRGYLLTRSREWKGEPKGIILSSFFFSMGHIPYRVYYLCLEFAFSIAMIAIFSFISALVFCYQYLKTKNIVLSIIQIILNIFAGLVIHVIWNVFSF